MSASRPIELIRRAFAGPSPLPPEAIVEHRCPECSEIASTFASRVWSEIPGEAIDACFQALPLLAPEAFREFLPAFMIRGLERADEGGLPNDVLEFTTYGLLPDDVNERWLQRVVGFSDEQVTTVLEFLREAYRRAGEYLGEPPRDAMHYWQERGRRTSG